MASVKRGDTFAGILFLVSALYAGFLSYDLEIGSLSSPEAGFLPLLVSALLFVTSIPLILLPFGGKEGTDSQVSERGKGAGRTVLFLLVLSVIYLGLLRFVGFWIDTFLLIPALYLLSGGKSLVRSILFSIVTIIVSYILFTMLLRVEFPHGVLLEAIPWR
jgi:hypothetical protein